MHYPEILSIQPAPVEIAWDEQRSLLYAVGLGAGADEADLPFVYEKGLQALPTMAVMLAGGSGDFFTKGGIDMTRLMHGEQRIHLLRPLPAAGRFRTQARCLGVVDKGAGKGALLIIESALSDADTGEPIGTTTSTLFCRGDGGCGAPSTGGLPERPVPGRPHDSEVAIATLPQQAAIYRLSGDRTDFHIDPAAARRSGLSASDPARPVHLWRGWPGRAARCLRQRPSPHRTVRSAVFRSGVSGGNHRHPHLAQRPRDRI